MGGDLNFKHPFSCLLSGHSGSGKTSFCIRFFQNLKTLCTVPDFSGWIICADLPKSIIHLPPSPSDGRRLHHFLSPMTVLYLK